MPVIIALIGLVLYETGIHQQIGDPYIRSIVSKTYEWRKRVNLTDDSIEKGLPRAVIEKRLKRLGYVPSDIKRNFYKASNEEDLWIKDVPGLPCRIDYVIVLYFENDKLKTAEGMQQERGCL